MISNLSRSSRALLRRSQAFAKVPYPAMTPSYFRHFASVVQNVPGLGDSITEGQVVEWSKNVGDYCAVDDIVAIIETDKVSVEIRAEESGALTELFAEIDDTVEVGAKLFSLDTDAAAPAGGAAPPPKQAEATPAPPATP